jgi:ribonuclease Z
MAFSVTVLGCSSALPTSDRYLSAHVLNAHERFFLIDCGEGTQLQLRKYKARLSKLDHIFITHMHGDHVYGLPGLLSTFNMLGRKNDLHLYAHASLEKFLTQFLSHFFNKLDFTIVYHYLNPSSREMIYEDNNMTVESFPLKHRIPCCGFVFRERQKLRNIRKDMIDYYQIPLKEIFNIKNGDDFVTTEGLVIANSILTRESAVTKSYAFCSDTAYLEEIVPYIKDVDLLYHEATFADEDLPRALETFHSTATHAATIARLAGVKRLIIGHFSARYKDATPLVEQARKIFPNTEAATEGLEIEL